MVLTGINHAYADSIRTADMIRSPGKIESGVTDGMISVQDFWRRYRHPDNAFANEGLKR